MNRRYLIISLVFAHGSCQQVATTYVTTANGRVKGEQQCSERINNHKVAGLSESDTMCLLVRREVYKKRGCEEQFTVACFSFSQFYSFIHSFAVHCLNSSRFITVFEFIISSHNCHCLFRMLPVLSAFFVVLILPSLSSCIQEQEYNGVTGYILQIMLVH